MRTSPQIRKSEAYTSLIGLQVRVIYHRHKGHGISLLGEIRKSVSKLLLMTLFVAAICTNWGLADEHFDPDNVPNQLIEPSSEQKPWFSRTEAHLATILKKESKLAAGIKVPVICIFCIDGNGLIDKLTFKTTSGSQENDTCAMEIIKRAVPFESPPATVQAPKRVTAQIGLQ